jgi:transposase
MRRPYLTVIVDKARQALHVFDHFHVVINLNIAVDHVRREVSRRLRGRALAKRPKKMRWNLLRRGSRFRGLAPARSESLLACRLASTRACNLEEAFQRFRRYRWVWYAGGLLDYWCERAMPGRIEPMKRIARMLRSHVELRLNWL